MSQDKTALPASEILRLAANGEKFQCPVCNSQLVTIPETLAAGERSQGIQCPKVQKHYLIYGDDAERILEMRKRMKLMDREKNRDRHF
ncbi:hypothetical protein [Enterovibrio norvegicus]|uniref:hypothetical protein n=1 Tax=Enterovibrio norvegicus TaxID=188144 RepID=UPI000C85745D|nr:hypothetical protein [Enterovibrio norvegicus]PML78518.1 hypothetical protein BCT69_03580 [Enterovibrio norvegicus]